MTKKETRVSLSDKQARGGLIGAKGYGFQAAYIVSQIPVWLADPDFSQFLQEGAGDVEVRFDRLDREERVYVQVKDHRARLAEARAAFGRFYAIDAVSPKTYGKFILACPGLHQDLNPLRSAVEDLRGAASFYRRGKDKILDNTWAELQSLVTKLKLPVDAEFLVAKVHFDTDLVGLTDDTSLCDLFVGRLLNLEGWSKVTTKAATHAYEKLALLSHKAIRKTCSRGQVESLIREAVGELPEDVAYIGAVPTPPFPYFAHPYPLQANFTGRVRERQMLTEWLTKDNRPLFAITAIGGMGKSAVTWSWVQRDVLDFPLPGQPEDTWEATDACHVSEAQRPEGMLWWSFYEQEACFSEFLDQALIYGSGGTVDLAKVTSVHDKVKALLNLLQQCPILIVLDGFERELRAYASVNAAYQGDAVTSDEHRDFRSCTNPHAANFLRWVASGALRGRVLITSRLLPRELEGLAGCRHEELKKLDPEDSVTFFRVQGVKGTRAEIQVVCKTYGNLPLALRLLSSLIIRDKQMPGDIRVANRYPVLPQLKGKEQHHILQVAYDALDQRKRTFLSHISASRGSMSYEAICIFKTHKKQQDFDRALDELIERGLLSFQPERRSYGMHPIVRAYSYLRLSRKNDVHRRLAAHFRKACDEILPEPLRKTPDRLWPSLSPETVHLSIMPGELADLLPVIELYHHTVRSGSYESAAVLFAYVLSQPLYYRFGAYLLRIELLEALLSNSQPRLRDQGWQRWTLNSLANTYCTVGQPAHAVPLFAAQNNITESAGDKENLAVGLFNLATMAQITLGRLEAACLNLLRGIELCHQIRDEYWGAYGRVHLGELLIYKGECEQAAVELDLGMCSFQALGQRHGICFTLALKSLRFLLMARATPALEAAREALQAWHNNVEAEYPVERTRVWGEWLAGAAAVALVCDEGAPVDKTLSEAEDHLTEALTRCRRINLVELEPDILLAWARWHLAKANVEQARRDAEEALTIADRCDYRLKQADIHNFMARLAMDEGNKKEARKHAEIAYDRAWCDGPPHCYRPALDEAEKMLDKLGGGRPTIK
jgi:tetratricopeptide (TPR) repeat protein